MKIILKSIFLVVVNLYSLTLFAATKTWDGGGGDANWMTAANWDSDVAPVAGDDLIFDGSVQTTCANNFAAATSFASISFAATASAFTLSGNSVTITGGATAITANNTSLTMTIGNNIIFSTAAPTITTVSGGTLAISGTIANGGLLITTTCDGTLTLSGVISGTGGFTKNGAGTCTMSAGNTMNGTTIISAGTLDFGGVSGVVAGPIVNNSAMIISGTSGADFTTVISGTGTLTTTTTNSTLSGNNTYSGLTTISSGKINITNANSLGATSAGTIINSTGTIVVKASVTFAAEPLTINSTGTLRTSNNGSNDIGDYTGAITLGTNTPDFYCYDANDVLTLSGVISGAFTARFGRFGPSTGGIVRLSAANTYSGNTELYAGILQLGAAGVINDASNFVAAGGTFSTGVTSGYSETLGTLTLNANTKIALGTGVHTLNFAASNGTTWTAAKLLRITGWQGGFDCTSGTSGRIYTGSSAELSAAKLAEIFFTHPISQLPYTACQLSDGEIVPTGTLPVKLISFDGKLKEDKVQLEWITASEINSEYFEIMRSNDGYNFESIGKINAAGNSVDFLNYVFYDPSPLNVVNYYKLVQYDFDGASEEFKIIAVSINKNEFKMNALYPNPSLNFITVNFQSEVAEAYLLSIVDEQGKEHYSAVVAGIEGENKFNLSTASFPNGSYFVKIIGSQNKIITSKIVIQH